MRAVACGVGPASDVLKCLHRKHAPSPTHSHLPPPLNSSPPPGIVVGSLAGVALLAGAAFLGLRSTKRTREGWTKETLDGAGNVVGGGSGRPRRTVGAGWGSRVAARDTDTANPNTAFGVMPPVREGP